MRRLLSPNHDLSLQLLALYLTLTIPFLVALVIFNQVVGQQVQVDVRANDLSLARAIAQETDVTIANALEAVRQLGSYPGVIEADTDEMETLFGVVLNTRPDVNLVYRLNENGIMLYHYPTGPGSTMGMDFSFREYFQRARQTRSPLISKGRISPTTQQPVATAVMPLWSEDGHFLGVVATNIKLESLSQSLVEIVAGHRAEDDFQVLILDSSAQVIAHPNPDNLLLQAADLLPNVYLHALGGETDSVVATDESGTERLYTYAPIPSAGWAVIINRPTAVAFATQNTIHRLTLVAFTTLLVVGLFIWIALSHRVITPIERLASISQAIGEGREISPENRRQLTILARRDDQIGHLIRTILRMEQSIKARIQEQATLLETSSAVVSSLDPQTVLNRILEQVGRLLDVKMCAIVALDERHGVFRIRASRGLSKRYTEQLAIQPSEPFSVSMRALRSRKPIQVSDTETDPSFAVQRPRARAEGYRSLLAVPLNTQHAPPSALLVYRKEPHVFTQDEIKLLVSFANHATMAIENAVLYARSDTRLQEETRRIEALIQSLHDGLIMGDPYGKVIYANRRIKELAGMTNADLRGVPVEKVIHRIVARSIRPQKMRREVSEVLEGDERREVEIPIRRFGRVLYLRLQTFDVTDAQGVLIGRGVTLRDVTADRELDRMKSNLISTVSHELRTPLAAIKGYATTLLAEDVEWDIQSQREFLTIISNETDRLSDLVNNLLDLSRIESGSLKLSRTECAIDEIIQQAARRAPLQPTNRFEVDIEPGLPPLHADPTRLETVLRNLIENAVKYAGPRASIRIRVTGGENAIIFRVEDDGPGIPPEERHRVFQSFYRVDNSLSRPASGAGLGLAICQGLVQAHGGEVWVEPRARGACIAFSIPLNMELKPQSAVRRSSHRKYRPHETPHRPRR